MFEKDTEDASTTNNIRKITKYSARYQTPGHTPVIHGRNELSCTSLNNNTAITVVYEDQFPFTPEEQTFDSFYPQIRREVATYLQLQPVNPTTPSTLNKILRIIKHGPKGWLQLKIILETII
jgi:hypothetical protein